MDSQRQQSVWKSTPEEEPESMATLTLGRLMTTLLSARPKKLLNSISRFPLNPQNASTSSLEESLGFLLKYVRDVAQRGDSLDEILVPIIEHSLRSKETKHGDQAIILLNWLFKDEFLFQAVASRLANVISSKDDRYLNLGWCTLVRRLLECEADTDQQSLDGIREKYDSLVKILCPCIPHLSAIICKGSTMQDGFELPSRLSVSAADCFLSITEALMKKPKVSSQMKQTSNLKAGDQSITSMAFTAHEKKVKQSSQPSSLEGEFLLWNHRQDLITLVQSFLAWSRKGRPLHAKGLERVLKWLLEIKRHYDNTQDEAGSKILRTGVLLLSSCWKHYSMLLHLEDHKFTKHFNERLDQYLSGIQYYTDTHSEGPMESKDGGLETRKFFLNCICLLLGRVDCKKFESLVSEYGTRMSHILLSQLHCGDEDIVEGVVCILKFVLLKLNYSSGASLTDTRQMDSVISLLLNLLDLRDSAAKAIVMLIAEYCSITADGRCLKEVLNRLSSENVIQRRNALDVLSELIHISSHSTNALTHMAWQDITNHLLECVGDKESVIREKTSDLLPIINPSLVLPALIHLIYSSDENVKSSATEACIGVLKHHCQKFEVICMLLDCLRNLNQSHDSLEIIKEGSTLDTDQVLRLTPQWSKSVQDWHSLIGPLIEKMFAEPSNAIMVRFLSYISEHLAEAADVVLSRVLTQMKDQKENPPKCSTSEDSTKMQQWLFECLCPLLVIRVLPLRVFDELNCSIIYGHLSEITACGYGDFNIADHNCIAALLLNRAFSKHEFEVVRKLAAELCGRLHPQVLLQVICSQLKHAVGSQDIMKIKACLFSICTSVMVRGQVSIFPPAVLEIMKMLEVVLLWPSSDGNEIYKAQHGCIDCLALMICAELQSPASSKDSTSLKNDIFRKSADHEDSFTRNSALTYVVHHIIHDEKTVLSDSKLGCQSCAIERPKPLSFRICMVNVLLTVSQKISDSDSGKGKKRFAQEVLPNLIRSAEELTSPEMRVGCIQVLFSAVYHLKTVILPFSSNLLKLSIKFLKDGSHKEKMAAAKLMASLMASEDPILANISEDLLEAPYLLSSIISNDPSLDLQQVCEKLLSCLTFT